MKKKQQDAINSNVPNKNDQYGISFDLTKAEADEIEKLVPPNSTEILVIQMDAIDKMGITFTYDIRARMSGWKKINNWAQAHKPELAKLIPIDLIEK